MSTGRTRQPAAIPVGGQFAAESRGRAAVSLDETVDAETGESALTSTGELVRFGEIDREQRIEAMRAEIDSAMENLSSPEGWAAFLDQSSKLHKYSLRNRLLLAMQNPEASMVAGFQDWKKVHGRQVKKGEKALWVMAPVTRKQIEKSSDGSEREASVIVGSRPVSVFDISQTEPIEGDERGTRLDRPNIAIAPLEGEAPAGMVDDLTRAATHYGFTIEHDETGTKSGYTDFQNKKIVLRGSDSERERASTLAHEVAHIACGHGERMADYHCGSGGQRPDMEVEAESVSYVLNRHYGIAEAGQAAFGYIDGWAKGDKDRVKATATTVVKATKDVLDIIDNQTAKAAA